MANLAKYVRKELDKGYTKAQVRKKLAKAGYAKSAIEDGIKAVSLSPRGPQIIWHKYATVLVMILVVVIVIGGVYFLVPEAAEVTKRVANFTKAIVPLKAEDVMLKKIKTCDAAEDRNVCLFILSKENDDTSLCSAIGDAFYLHYCDDAIWREDECRYLTLIGGNSSQCYLDKALESDDPSICLLSENPAECRGMLALKSENYALCDTYECVKLLVDEGGDSSICDTLLPTADFLPETCRQIFAAERADPELCKGETECLLTLSDTPEEKKALFEQLKEQRELEGPEIFFIMEVYVESEEDLLLCETLTLNQAQLSQYAVGRAGVDVYDLCVLANAYRRGKESFCSYLKAGSLQSSCISIVKRSCPPTDSFCSTFLKEAEEGGVW